MIRLLNDGVRHACRQRCVIRQKMYQTDFARSGRRPIHLQPPEVHNSHPCASCSTPILESLGVGLPDARAAASTRSDSRELDDGGDGTACWTPARPVRRSRQYLYISRTKWRAHKVCSLEDCGEFRRPRFPNAGDCMMYPSEVPSHVMAWGLALQVAPSAIAESDRRRNEPMPARYPRSV